MVFRRAGAEGLKKPKEMERCGLTLYNTPVGGMNEPISNAEVLK